MIPAPRERVWELMNDPKVLKECIPGCEALEQVSPDSFRARVVLKVGPVKAKFEGEVELTDKIHPESYRIVGAGKGGVAGMASGGAFVKLDEEAEGTRLSYVVDARLGGKIAQIGSRLVKSSASKLAKQFFTRFSEIASEGATA